MSRIVVTGGAGLIGSHLVDRCVAEGHAVVVVDNLVTGRAENVAAHAGHAGFEFLRADVTRPLAIRPPVDAIFHLASPASPVDFARIPIEILLTGALGTHHVCELAVATGARVLLASTSEVYGDPEVHPQREDYWGHVNPIGPRAVYDEAKRYAEAMVSAYRRHRGVATRIARIFNTYGERQRVDDGRALATFVVQALRGEPLTVFGDGAQTRSFCHVSDLVDGLVRLMASDEPGPVNLGNPDEVTIETLAREVIAATGSRSRLERRPLPQDDPKQRRPDITLARTRLGWEPRVPRAEGVRRLVADFRARLDRGDGR